MKKTLLLLILCTSTLIFGQETAVTESGKKVQLNKNGTYKYLTNSKDESTTLKDSDITTIADQVKSKKNTLFVLNGDEVPVETKFTFSCTANRYSTISIDQLNSMISTANIKSMFQMKNRRTYVPKKITFFFSDKQNGWMASVEYIAQNDYGATKDGTAFVTFDELGTFKDVIIL